MGSPIELLSFVQQNVELGGKLSSFRYIVFTWYPFAPISNVAQPFYDQGKQTCTHIHAHYFQPINNDLYN